MLVKAYGDVVLPEEYFSLMSIEDKFSYAENFAQNVRSKGLTPVLSTVTGSTLRGLDHKDSDVDGLVVVKENYVPTRKLDTDVFVLPMKLFVDKFAFSIHFNEVLSSPFLLVDSNYKAFFGSLRGSALLLDYHIQKHVYNSYSNAVKKNGNVLTDKNYRQLFSMWWYYFYRTPLIDRKYYDRNNAPVEFWDWLDSTVKLMKERESYYQSQCL